MNEFPKKMQAIFLRVFSMVSIEQFLTNSLVYFFKKQQYEFLKETLKDFLKWFEEFMTEYLKGLVGLQKTLLEKFPEFQEGLMKIFPKRFVGEVYEDIQIF